jgi:hypothetical protein
MIVVWLGRLGFGILMLEVGLSAVFFLASFGDATWLYIRESTWVLQLSSQLYGAFVVGILLNFPLTVALMRAPKVVPAVRRSLPRLLTPWWPVGITVLVGIALFLCGVYVNSSWVMPPLDESKEALTRFTESGAIRNLRTMTLNTMGWNLYWGGFVLSWFYQYANVRRVQPAPA